MTSFSIPVSIIIATFNRADLLRETLNNLIFNYGDILGKTNSEILVIDNNSKDNTESIVNNFGQMYPFVKYYLELSQGLSYGRNRGIQEAKNEYLIFADDDIEVDKFWLQESINPLLNNSEIGVVGAKVVPFNHDVPDWIPSKYFWLIGITDLGNTKRIVNYVMGASMAMRKSIFSEIGLFDATLGRTGNQLLGGEETDLQKRMRTKGYKVYYNPDALVYHKITTKLNENYILKFAYLDGVSNKRIDSKTTKFRYLLKSTYGFLTLYIFLPLKKIYTNPIEINIRKRYFEGYLAQE
ncbi:glycosyltransferase family 2 protein [Spirosoma harenae]